MTQSPKNDLAFIYAVEESIIRFNKIPREFERKILPLSSPSYKIRQSYHEKLYKEIDNSSIRLLFWGRRYKDKEVVYRCNNILARFYKCNDCKGEGIIDKYFDCGICGGIGTIWGLSPWD